ncbi:extracellular solute-binding protein [Oleiphilus messinensis]|uniref:extracellular solute-binding protein n=1 Tax=Oleiphilus messinensis TaxID=141451 RepID=UPI0012FA3E64|nr:extracellular solute-binding protein [Oleiphilus messinensis]
MASAVSPSIDSPPISVEQSGLTTSHGFALYGELKYPPDFKHFDYTNPNAPKGGEITLMGFGTFDTLNPYTLKGISPWGSPGFFMYGIGELNESLLAGSSAYLKSGDEPFSAYGLIAKHLTYPADFSWVEFELNSKAQFHDGHPIDADDVIYSYHILISEGHPIYRQSLEDIADVQKVNSQRVRFNFKARNKPSAILRAGEMPILPEHFWSGREFKDSLTTPPLLSGPYRISEAKLGNRVTFQRVPNHWGKDHPVYKGRFNFDTVHFDFYRDQTIAFEAFKSDEFDVFYDYTAKNWATAYTFPALKQGKVVKAEIPHDIPSPTQAIVFNTRRAPFDDIRVREAFSLMFDFEWTNTNLFHDAYRRTRSFYPNSPFSANKVISPKVKALLISLGLDEQSPILNQPLHHHETNGNGNIRPQQRQALALLKDAGWTFLDGKLLNAEMQPLSFELLIRQKGLERVMLPYLKNLERLGIEGSLRLVDSSQYKVRLDQFDFDLTTHIWSQSPAPGHEQKNYFHSTLKSVQGSQNYAGIANPIIDRLTERITQVKDYDELIVTMKALDRMLLSEHYVIPNWHIDYHRVAYWNKFGLPQQQAEFVLGFENWWYRSPIDDHK